MLVLSYALHGFQPFLALVGLRPPLAVGFGLREPNGWMPRIYSGHPIPALRPEQSDHVPWTDCPQGLSSTSARCAHPPGKRLLLPILTAGLAMSRAMELDSFHQLLERARARLFPPSKWAGLFPSAAYRRSAPPQVALGRLKWRRLGCSDAAEMVSQRRKTGLFFAVGAIHTPIAPLGILQNGLDIFATKKASVVFYPR